MHLKEIISKIKIIKTPDYQQSMINQAFKILFLRQLNHFAL